MAKFDWNCELRRYEAELNTANRLFVGYSGGVDSHVLLHLLQGKFPQKIHAIHVNHGLSANADSWQSHCEGVSQRLGVPLISRRVSVLNQGKGIEAAARDQRYRCFNDILEEGDLLVLGHHQGDQAETVLFRLLRGSGVKGLAGISPSRIMGSSPVVRPLLGIPKHQIIEYAEEFNLSWVEDESNQDVSFDRNYIRHTLLPTMSDRWPSVEEAISRSAEHCAESAELNDILAEQDLKSVGVKLPGESFDCLDIAALSRFDRVRQKNMIRFWLDRSASLTPSYAQLRIILDELLAAQEDATPLVSLKSRDQDSGASRGYELRRFRERLYLLPALGSLDVDLRIPWQGQSEIELPGNGMLTFSTTMGQGIRVSQGAQLSIRYRQGGERFHPADRAHSQSLKKLLQAEDVPPWIRPRIPLIDDGESIVSVVGLWDARGVQVDSDEEGIVVEWIQ